MANENMYIVLSLVDIYMNTGWKACHHCHAEYRNTGGKIMIARYRMYAVIDPPTKRTLCTLCYLTPQVSGETAGPTVLRFICKPWDGGH